MSILSAIKSFFSAIGAAFKFFGDKQLMDAGEAKAEGKSSKKALDNVAKANRAANDPDTIDRLRGSRFRD